MVQYIVYPVVGETLLLPGRPSDGKSTSQVAKFIRNTGSSDTIRQKKEALAALADFNADPYDPDTAALTFEDVYLRWSTEHYSEISAANARGYRSVWSIMEKLCGMRFVDVRLDHLQDAVDRSGKNAPTLRKLKSMLSLMYKYAVAHGIISKERDIVAYLNVSRAGNPNALLRTPFSTEEL